MMLIALGDSVSPACSLSLRAGSRPLWGVSFCEPTLRAATLLSSDKVRFVLAGGWNTLLYLVTFTAVQLLWGESLGYVLSLTVAASIVTLQAYFVARRWVWRSTSEAHREFPRFIFVYVVQYTANLLLLYCFVNLLGAPVIPAQLMINGLLLMMSYFAHRGWTFRTT
ncbi:Putative flippase GtrA (transmembrane translocase of bactoprenol-linked glucose) [Frankineae bacterium MT45]|nr:Putative flippase GtrA (transmembrane translocase of bactoprenol-linked glucose) [Frankineae bacterium MT45]